MLWFYSWTKRYLQPRLTAPILRDRHILLPLKNKVIHLYIYIKKSFPNQRKFPALKGVLQNEIYHNEYWTIERKILFV